MIGITLVWALIFTSGDSAGRVVYFETQPQCEQALKAVTVARNGWMSGVCVKAVR
jgi:hypothetical protein